VSYIHKKCNGIIDSNNRECTRCHKKWNWFMFYFNTNEMRPVPRPMQDRIDRASKKLAKEIAKKKKGGVK
jgi:hypothetical protein